MGSELGIYIDKKKYIISKGGGAWFWVEKRENGFVQNACEEGGGDRYAGYGSGIFLLFIPKLKLGFFSFFLLQLQFVCFQ